MNSETDSNLTSPVDAAGALDSSDHDLSPASSNNHEFSSPSVGSINNNANSSNEYGESHITPRRFRGQTIVAQASSTSKQSTLADDYTPLQPVDLLKVSHKFKSSVDDRSNRMARGRSGSYPGLVGHNNGRRALEEGGNSDRTRRTSNDSAGVSPTARSSFDSL